MNGNPDPKPGRWILPLIIIAMVGFTYVFVSSLDEQVPEETDAGLDLPVVDTSSTTTPAIIDTTTSTTGPTIRDLYAEEITSLAAEVQVLSAEFAQISADWDARSIEFGPTREAMEAKLGELQAWQAKVGDSVAPAGEADLAAPHLAIIQAAEPPIQAGLDALDGLVNSPTAEERQEAVVRLTETADAFAAAVNAALSLINS